MKNDNRLENAEKYKRDQYGLMKNVEYIFNEDGSVNWKKMVDPQFVYPNEKWFTDRKQPIPETAEGLEDEQCIISLAGFKKLLSLRGYSSQTFSVINDKDGVVSVKCSITFSPNYETSGQEVIKEDIASAGTFNVDPEFINYVHTIAANRALCRTIRSFLNIHVVSKEELADKTAEKDVAVSKATDITPLSMMLKSGFNEEAIRAICVEHNLDNTWESLESLDENKSLARKIWAKSKK